MVPTLFKSNHFPKKLHLVFFICFGEKKKKHYLSTDNSGNVCDTAQNFTDSKTNKWCETYIDLLIKWLLAIIINLYNCWYGGQTKIQKTSQYEMKIMLWALCYSGPPAGKGSEAAVASWSVVKRVNYWVFWEWFSCFPFILFYFSTICTEERK